MTEPAAAGGHTHSSLLQRWDQVFPEPAADGSAETLIATCVRAAVLVPESEPPGWFSFSPRIDAGVVGRLVDEGALCRPAPGWLALSA